MSASVIILPVARVERHGDDTDVALRVVLSPATARTLQKAADQRCDGDLSRCAAMLLHQCAIALEEGETL